MLLSSAHIVNMEQKASKSKTGIFGVMQDQQPKPVGTTKDPSKQANRVIHLCDPQEPLLLMLASRRRRRGLSLRRQRLYDLETTLLLAFAFQLPRRRVYRRRHWIPCPTKLASMTSTQSLMGMAPGTLG